MSCWTGLCVDHPVADAGIFRPGRNQSPTHLFHVPLAVITDDDQNTAKFSTFFM
jgi:hypothetical protein